MSQTWKDEMKRFATPARRRPTRKPQHATRNEIETGLDEWTLDAMLEKADEAVERREALAEQAAKQEAYGEEDYEAEMRDYEHEMLCDDLTAYIHGSRH